VASGDKTVAGTDGSGKTFLVKHKLIQEAVEAGNKVAIIDVEDEYGEVSDAVVDRPEDFIRAFKDGHDVVRYKIKHRLKEPTRPTHLEHNGKELDKVLRKVVAYQGDLQVVLDEAHNFQSNSKMYSGMLYKILKQGDKHGINLIQASQEPQDFHRNSWSLGGDIIAMPMRDLPRKLEDLLDNGNDPRELSQYHYIHVPADPSAPSREYPPIST
jgi:DNA helicase HerA-like ATPase